jgi:hypothetical protein
MMHEDSAVRDRREPSRRLHLLPAAFQAGMSRVLMQDWRVRDVANDRGPDPPRPKPVRAPRPRARERDEAWMEALPVRWFKSAA